MSNDTCVVRQAFPRVIAFRLGERPNFDVVLDVDGRRELKDYSITLFVLNNCGFSSRLRLDLSLGVEVAIPLLRRLGSAIRR